ncbi:MAG: sensor histidine kinase [Lachnospiraceae bacterium]|uniref:histidine kinase n=1 Tax=Candidatus Weimeria bifida TaxID=2599074 RepID=A0A6N7IW98_9FIRM|nr:HAMP domain-containing protein [Candidatus Weimeria bifida]RRF96088.1 MAG: sensor histidine kinase [Lachnospiraceae bacterium]
MSKPHRDKNKKRKYSVSRQITGYMVFIAFGAIFISFVLNWVFMTNFSKIRRENVLIKAYKELSKVDKKDILYEDSYDDEFETMCSNENLQILICTPAGKVVRTSQGSNAMMIAQLYNSMLSRNQDNRVVEKTSSDYSILRLKDEQVESEFLMLWGTLPDSNLVLIRTGLGAIKQTMRFTARVLIVASCIAVFMAWLASLYFSKRVTDPVIKLTKISKKMTDLDFDVKYVPSKKPNEIDDLGVHMNELSETLEKTIAELKQANSDLQRDLDLRDKNEKMRREFSSSVSHELKTPLALIMGYAEGLSDAVADDNAEDRKYYCDVIVDEANKMNRIVKELLDLSHLEYGEKILNLERFDVVEVIEGVIKSNSILTEKNGITVSFIHNGPACVWADPFFIEQVITNYFSNAIHYCENERKIEVKITEREKDYRISVFNSGNPIPEESIPHLWEKFYKVDKARTREYGGSGIGLSIVKAIMDDLHKECGVVNHANGVEFYFDLDK